jgi:hypothetical protein
MMFALPIALFEACVGRDELYYRLLQYRYGPRSTYFQDQDVNEAFDRHVNRIGVRERPDRSYDEIASLEDLRWQYELETTPNRRTLFTRYQEQAARDCDEFIKYFPHSRYAPPVLYLKGRALDMRVDPVEFRARKRLVFYDTYPSMASRDTWLRLLANAPDSSLAAVAAHRLALLEARSGKVSEAITLLRRLERFEEPAASTRPSTATGIKGILKTAPPERGLQVPVENVVFEGKRLLGILENNRDPLYGDDPITGPQGSSAFPRLGWALFDPESEHYRQNLMNLLARYPRCQLTDNIEVELARTLSDLGARIAALERCVDQYTRGSALGQSFRDAVPEALYRLGEAYLSAGRTAGALRVFERLVEQHPESIWVERTNRRTAALGPATPVES